MSSSERKEHLSLIQSLLSHELDPQFQERLIRLHNVCSNIETYYHEYDFRNVPCNGFRTFVKVISLFFSNLAQACRQPLKNQDLINDFMSVSELLCINADAAILMRQKGHNYPLQCTDQDCAILTKSLLIQPRHLEPIYGKIGPFFLLPEIQRLTTQTLTAINLMTAPVLEKAYMIFSPKYRYKRMATNALAATLEYLHSMRKIDQFPLSLIFRVVIRPVGCSARYVSVPRDFNEWTIHVTDPKSPAVIERTGNNRQKTQQLDCLLISPNSGPENGTKSLIIHLPSGGMILSLANLYTTFMSKVSRKLGVPVMVVKYALAPENRYPVAVQEILDLYMFVTSGDPAVSEMLGFQPENILLSGDSAGGHLATISMLALNEIRRKGGNVQMPKALALQYPAMTIGFVANASVVAMSGLDVLTTIGELRFAIAAYVETDPPIDLSISIDDVPKDGDLNELMKRFNDRLRDPLFCPLVYKHMHDLRGVPLSVLVCEMDCILDHGIEIARAWPGPVTLDAAWGLPHGFPVGEETPAVVENIHLLTKRMADLLDVVIDL